MENLTSKIEIPSLIQNRIYKKLTFREEGLFVEKTRSFDPPVFIPAVNLVAFRYGVKPIRGYAFVIGRQFQVELLDSAGKITSIKETSYYRLKRKAYNEIWADTISQLWSSYFVNTFNYYYELYNIKQQFVLSDVKFYPFGISLDNHNLFWNEIGIKNYQTYFTIHHRDDLKKIKHRNFKNDWNALILQTLVKAIIKEQDTYRKTVGQ